MSAIEADDKHTRRQGYLGCVRIFGAFAKKRMRCMPLATTCQRAYFGPDDRCRPIYMILMRGRYLSRRIY